MTDPLPPLDDALITRRLLTEGGGAYAKVQRMDSVGSTNEWLSRALAAEAQSLPQSPSQPQSDSQQQAVTAWPHLSVLTAEEQTGGRGRLGRLWSSPKGASLSTSIVLRPQLDPAHLGWVSMLAGRALVDALRHDFGLDAEGQRAVLKWPNDVQVTQPGGPARKISGILATAVPGTAAVLAAPGAGQAAPGAGPSAVVLGVGINVLLTPEQLPIEHSTSVLIEISRRRAESESVAALAAHSQEAARLRTELLCRHLERFADLLGVVEAAARQDPETVPQVLISLVGEVLTTLGQEVRVELPDGSAERGRAQELTSEGALKVEVAARRAADEHDWVPCRPEVRAFSAGDVTHLRPMPR